MKIEQLKEEDFDEAWELKERLLGDNYRTKEFVKDYFLKNPKLFFVAKNNEQIIGFKFGGNEGEKETVVGWGVGVIKEYRRKGVGRKLYENFIKEAKKQGFTKYVFGSATEEGIPFHISCGNRPFLFIQLKEKELKEVEKKVREKFQAFEKKYSPIFEVWQIKIGIPKEACTKEYLNKLERELKTENIQFVFEKNLTLL